MGQQPEFRGGGLEHSALRPLAYPGQPQLRPNRGLACQQRRERLHQDPRSLHRVHAGHATDDNIALLPGHVCWHRTRWREPLGIDAVAHQFHLVTRQTDVLDQPAGDIPRHGDVTGNPAVRPAPQQTVPRVRTARVGGGPTMFAVNADFHPRQRGNPLRL